MSNTYTPGPWNASKSQYQGLVISEATGANVAVTHDVKDADLVAAAPKMLELCELALRCLDEDEFPTLRDDLRAVIYEAKGL